MKKIKLTQGKYALVDDSDYDWLSQFNWYAGKDNTIKRSNYYATTNIRNGEKWKTLLMHRFILQPPPNKQVDHINRNGLDNRRANIRVCTASQNQGNREDKRGTSKFKGVYKKKGQDKWTAQIKVLGKIFRIGDFSLEENAGRAYDLYATKYFGKFARLNFPNKEEE